VRLRCSGLCRRFKGQSILGLCVSYSVCIGLRGSPRTRSVSICSVNHR
jgi:hypothetical protein